MINSTASAPVEKFLKMMVYSRFQQTRIRDSTGESIANSMGSIENALNYLLDNFVIVRKKDSTISPFLLMMLGILLKTNLDISNDSVQRRAEVLIKSNYPDIRFPEIRGCPSCDTRNPITAKYCMSCGTPLRPN